MGNNFVDNSRRIKQDCCMLTESNIVWRNADGSIVVISGDYWGDACFYVYDVADSETVSGPMYAIQDAIDYAKDFEDNSEQR